MNNLTKKINNKSWGSIPGEQQRITAIRMDLSCNETMINDVENEYNIYVEYPSDGSKSSATSAGDQKPTLSTGIAKLYSNAGPDPTFLKDRCLKNLLTSQKRYKTPSCAYFNTVQKTLTPQMRKIVAEWVIEVSVGIFFLTEVTTTTKVNYASPVPSSLFPFAVQQFVNYTQAHRTSSSPQSHATISFLESI